MLGLMFTVPALAKPPPIALSAVVTASVSNVLLPIVMPWLVLRLANAS